jgi:hypothetical protein
MGYMRPPSHLVTSDQREGTAYFELRAYGGKLTEESRFLSIDDFDAIETTIRSCLTDFDYACPNEVSREEWQCVIQALEPLGQEGEEVVREIAEEVTKWLQTRLASNQTIGLDGL